jgi:transposase-like protein
MEIKSKGYFGKNVRFICEVCGRVYDVESRNDWKINLVNMQIQER